MRAVRAVTILEHFGEAEARPLLELIATGEAVALPTIAARCPLATLLRSPQQTLLAQPSQLIEPTSQQFQSAALAFAKIGGQFSKEMDWTTSQPIYLGSLPQSATDDDLKKLPVVPFSFGLSLANQEKITDAAMAKLESVKNLRYLSLHGTNVTDAGLKKLAKLQDLSSLDLSWSTKITNLALLPAQRILSALNLDATRVEGSGLREISRLKGLRFLDLSSNDVDDADIREIVKLQKLGVAESELHPGNRRWNTRTRSRCHKHLIQRRLSSAPAGINEGTPWCPTTGFGSPLDLQLEIPILQLHETSNTEVLPPM